jgi:hypothetical protein
VAQLGARFHGMEEVIGSIPIRSTNKLLQCSDLVLPEPFPEGPEAYPAFSAFADIMNFTTAFCGSLSLKWSVVRRVVRSSATKRH